MKRFTTLLLLMALLLIVMPISAQDEEDEDDDPTLLSVPLLEPDFLVLDTMEHFGTPNLYAFVGTAGDEITLTMVPSSGSRLDPYLILIGAAGEVLAANDDRSGDDLSAEIASYELPFDGAYFVLATTFNDLIQGGVDGSDDEDGPYEYQILLEGSELPDGIEEVEEFEYFSSIAEPSEPVLLETTESEPISPACRRRKASRWVDAFREKRLVAQTRSGKALTFSASSKALSGVSAIGFSACTCLPASRARSTSAGRMLDRVLMLTASMDASSRML